MHVLAVEIDIHIPAAQSLKDRRQVVQSVLAGARQRYRVSAAEVAGQDTWQRAGLGFAVVAADVGQAESVMAEVERFVWSFPELDVLGTERTWLSP